MIIFIVLSLIIASSWLLYNSVHNAPPSGQLTIKADPTDTNAHIMPGSVIYLGFNHVTKSECIYHVREVCWSFSQTPYGAPFHNYWTHTKTSFEIPADIFNSCDEVYIKASALVRDARGVARLYTPIYKVHQSLPTHAAPKVSKMYSKSSKHVVKLHLNPKSNTWTYSISPSFQGSILSQKWSVTPGFEQYTMGNTVQHTPDIKELYISLSVVDTNMSLQELRGHAVVPGLKA